MGAAIELPYVHHIVLVLQHSSFVIIYIKIIGCGEYCDERWKASRLAFSVHTVSGVLRLVGADDREQIVVLQKLAAGCIAVEIRATPDGIVSEVFIGLLGSKIFAGVRPQEVTHGPERGRFLEPVDLLDIVDGMDFRRKSAVNAKELLVHQRGQRQTVEGVHAGIVDAFRVFNLTLRLEGEIFAEMPAFVVASQQEQRVGVKDLQGPKVKHAFYAKISPVYVVAEEEVASFVGRAADFEQFHQVVELSVNIAADGDRGFYVNDRLLLPQQSRAFADDAQGHVLLRPSLADEVCLEDVGTRLRLVVDLVHLEAVTGRRGNGDDDAVRRRQGFGGVGGRSGRRRRRRVAVARHRCDLSRGGGGDGGEKVRAKEEEEEKPGWEYTDVGSSTRKDQSWQVLSIFKL